jgi:hypothetical protein
MAGKKVRSAKGMIIDFDLLKIKEQISNTPAPSSVRARQDHIDQRLRRRLRKAQAVTAAPAVTAAGLPAAANPNQPEALIGETEKTPTKTKQKARPKKKTPNNT